MVLTAAVAGAALAAGVLVFGGFLLREDEAPGAESEGGDVVAAADALSASIVLVEVEGPTGMISGSGVSLGDGQVVTGGQLVDTGTTVTVIDAAGRRHSSRVVGNDGESNLALMEVDAPLPPAPLGRADLLADEASVVAMSAARGPGHWMHPATLRGRDLLVTTSDGDVFAGLLATDAPTGAAHVGGALVDRDGKVVGILVSPPGASTTGAALPIETVTGVCDQLRRNGTADHGWLGVTGSDGDGGIEVEGVVDASPAEEAGLEPGDTIIAIGDEPLEGIGALAAAIRDRRPGDDVHLLVQQDGTAQRMTITLGSLESSPLATP